MSVSAIELFLYPLFKIFTVCIYTHAGRKRLMPNFLLLVFHSSFKVEIYFFHAIFMDYIFLAVPPVHQVLDRPTQAVTSVIAAFARV